MFVWSGKGGNAGDPRYGAAGGNPEGMMDSTNGNAAAAAAHGMSDHQGIHAMRTAPLACPFARSLTPLNQGIHAKGTAPLTRPFARTAHSFTGSALLASLARSARALRCAHEYD